MVRQRSLSTILAHRDAVGRGRPLHRLRISNGSKASPSDAREKPPWAPPGTAATRPFAGKLPGLMAVCLEDGEGEGGPSLFGDGALAAAHRFFPYPLPLGDRRSSIWGDSTARTYPEMCVERAETASEPFREGGVAYRRTRGRRVRASRPCLSVRILSSLARGQSVAAPAHATRRRCPNCRAACMRRSRREVESGP